MLKPSGSLFLSIENAAANSARGDTFRCCRAFLCSGGGVKVTEAERAVPSECTKAVCLACVRVSCFQKKAFTLHPLSPIR